MFFIILLIGAVLALGFVGFAMMLILYSNSRMKTSYLLIMLFAISFSIALGVGVEVIKFYLKLYFGYEFTSGDYTHVMTGLTFVSAGALFSATLDPADGTPRA